MRGAHPVYPANELERRSGKHPADAVLHGAHVVTGQEIARADLGAAATARASAEPRLLGKIAVTDAVLRSVVRSCRQTTTAGAAGRLRTDPTAS